MESDKKICTKYEKDLAIRQGFASFFSVAGYAATQPNTKQTNMIKTLSTLEAAHELFNDGDGNWTRAGALALVEHLEEHEDSTGENIEFNVVDLRCEYSEHASLQEWAHDYFSNALEEMGFDDTEEIDDDEFDEKIREYINDHGQLIEFDGGVIVSYL